MRTSSIEQPLWRALTAYRVLALAYAVARFGYAYGQFAHPLGACFYMGVLAAWTLLTLPYVSSAARCTRPFLAADLTVALTGVLLTMVLDSPARIVAGQTTLPSIWAAGSVLAFAIKGAWRWGALAWVITAASNIVERGRVTEGNVHSIVLLFFEILKSTRTGRSSILEHMLSVGVFVLFLIEFLLVGAAASSVFFILMLMSIIDVIGGFTVSITSAGRDVNMG